MSPAQDYDPQQTIALVALVAALAIYLFRKIREIASKTSPDPWPQEVDLAVKARDAVPMCINCLYPQEGHRWFCPHCAFPTGEYVTIMPYLQIFAVGEVFRRGVIGPPETGFARKAFFVIYSASEYVVFAPIYWFWMARKARGKPICRARRDDLKFEEPVYPITGDN
jgi:hypothetical protein